MTERKLQSMFITLGGDGPSLNMKKRKRPDKHKTHESKPHKMDSVFLTLGDSSPPKKRPRTGR